MEHSIWNADSEYNAAVHASSIIAHFATPIRVSDGPCDSRDAILLTTGTDQYDGIWFHIASVFSDATATSSGNTRRQPDNAEHRHTQYVAGCGPKSLCRWCKAKVERHFSGGYQPIHKTLKMKQLITLYDMVRASDQHELYSNWPSYPSCVDQKVLYSNGL